MSNKNDWRIKLTENIIWKTVRDCFPFNRPFINPTKVSVTTSKITIKFTHGSPVLSFDELCSIHAKLTKLLLSAEQLVTDFNIVLTRIEKDIQLLITFNVKPRWNY